MASSSNQVLAKALRLSSLLVLSVAIIGGGMGLAFAGSNGMVSGLLGAAIALAFTSLTLLSVLFGARLPLGGFYGLVLGGWLIKIVLFAIAMAGLQRAEFVHGPTMFFVIVASVLGGLAIDSWVVLKSRIPTVG